MLSRQRIPKNRVTLFVANETERTASDIGAQIITYTILGVPYCKYNIMGPKTLF